MHFPRKNPSREAQNFSHYVMQIIPKNFTLSMIKLKEGGKTQTQELQQN